MCRRRLPAAHFTFPFLFKACDRAFAESPLPGFPRKGAELHCRVVHLGFAYDPFVQNSLIFMYSKCTNLHDARKVFDEMAEKTLVSWNAMITAYDRSGDQAAAERLFREMPERNVTSWNGMIARHVRVGDMRAAQILFDEMPERDAISWNSMIAVYICAKNHKRALELDVKHYGCMVDLLSRCGMVEEAYRMIKEMPVKANSVMWNTVLAACRVHGNVELGEKAFKELLEMDSMGDDEVVTMSNIYAETGRWDDVKRLRSRVTGFNIWKQAAWCQIELLH